jgi:hypothetical protein
MSVRVHGNTSGNIPFVDGHMRRKPVLEMSWHTPLWKLGGSRGSRGLAGGLAGGLAVVSGRVCGSSTRWGPRGKIKVKGGVGVCLGILCHFQLFSKR